MTEPITLQQDPTVEISVSNPGWNLEEMRFFQLDVDELYDLSVSLNRMFDRLQYSFQRQKEFIVKDEFDQIFTEAGASGLNAGTMQDATFYFINVPANKLELWFWMESDRLLNAVFRELAERISQVGDDDGIAGRQVPPVLVVDHVVAGRVPTKDQFVRVAEVLGCGAR